MSSDTDNITDPASLLRQQESLRKVIELISSELELRPLLTRIVRHACDLLDADNGTIGLLDTQRNVIRTEAAYRMPPDEIGAEAAPGVGLFGQVYRAMEPVVLSRYADVEIPTQLDMLDMTVIGVPIVWRGRLVGVFGLGSPPPRTFTAQDVETLSLFAKHAAIAIENARLFEGMQSALDEMQLLYETGRRINTALTMEDVVAAYLEQVAARGQFDCTIVLYETDARGQKTHVLVRGWWRRGEGMALQTQRHVYTHDTLDPPLEAGQTVTITDVFTDARVSPELREIQRQSQRPALAFIPLIAHGERIGLVVLSCPTIHSWRAEELWPYEATASQLAAVLQSRRQQLELSERGQRVAVLEERQRLARDLHDSVTQMIFSVTLLAQAVAPAWRRDPIEGEQRVQRLLELSRAALGELRSLVADLRPADPPSPAAENRPSAGTTPLPLVQKIAEYARAIAPESLYVTLRADTYTVQSPAVEEALYRIGQEALNNVVKHAQARQVEVRLAANQSAVVLSIQDDGVGMQSRPKNPDFLTRFNRIQCIQAFGKRRDGNADDARARRSAWWQRAYRSR